MGKSCDWYLKGASRFMNGVFAYSYQQVDFNQPFSNFVSRAPFENSTWHPRYVVFVSAELCNRDVITETM